MNVYQSSIDHVSAVFRACQDAIHNYGVMLPIELWDTEAWLDVPISIEDDHTSMWDAINEPMREAMYR